MANTMIYTIGRKYGSGGHEVGRALAERLGIPLYDGELITKTAEESGLCQEILHNLDEKPPANFFHPYWMTPFQSQEQPLGQKIFLAQAKVIETLANKGPGVFVGRCADYVLRNRENLISTFIYAPLEVRAKRLAASLGIDEEEARKEAIKIDKGRESYYNFFTDKKWGRIRSYNFIVSSVGISIDDVVSLIIDYAGKRAAFLKAQSK